jgi:PAP2 superfamily protein
LHTENFFPGVLKETGYFCLQFLIGNQKTRFCLTEDRLQWRSLSAWYREVEFAVEGILSGFLTRIRPNTHYLLSGALAVSILPLSKFVHLPFSVNWDRLLPLYWVGLGLRAVLAALVFGLIGLPMTSTVKPVWSHFWARRLRIWVFGAFATWALFDFGLRAGLVVIFIAVVLTESVDRSEGNPRTIGRWFGSVITPAAYFFVGLILVFAYNDVISAAKDPGGYDWVFLKIDSYLLNGRSVSELAHVASLKLPTGALRFSETVYYGMFDQIGAAIILISLCHGTKQALRFIGTLLTAYYLALLLFYLWPSMGPYYTCPEHFARVPHWLTTYSTQTAELLKAKLVAGPNRGLIKIDTDYFIAFPCLHLAQPIIVLWFMRRWKRIVFCLVAYDILLIPAILLLEWHYVIDLLGGAAVAVVAILLNRSRKVSSAQQSSLSKDSADWKADELVEIVTCNLGVSVP